MSKAKIQSTIERAISKADSSYFFEDYSKQARAVVAAIEAAGYIIVPKEISSEVALQASNEMRTGRIKPDAHCKDVYETILRIVGTK